jgi:hypothetical protein
MAQPQLYRVDRHHETSIFLLSRFPHELAAVAHLACVEAGKRLAGEVVEGGRDVFGGDGGDLAVDGSFVAVEVDLRGKEGKGKKQYVELELTTEKRWCRGDKVEAGADLFFWPGLSDTEEELFVSVGIAKAVKSSSSLSSPDRDRKGAYPHVQALRKNRVFEGYRFMRLMTSWTPSFFSGISPVPSLTQRESLDQLQLF